jgi:hypothetical protein
MMTGKAILRHLSFLGYRGHWYTCPLGHVYVITEVGNAVYLLDSDLKRNYSAAERCKIQIARSAEQRLAEVTIL